MIQIHALLLLFLLPSLSLAAPSLPSGAGRWARALLRSGAFTQVEEELPVFLARWRTASSSDQPQTLVLAERLGAEGGFLSRLRVFESLAVELQASRVGDEPFQKFAANVLNQFDQPAVYPNLFEGFEARGELSRLELQRLALETALKDAGASSPFGHNIARKLPHFAPVNRERATDFLLSAELLDPSALQADALAYLLQTFRHPVWDRDLTATTLSAIRESGRLTPSQAQVVIEFARGARISERAHAELANEILRQSGQQLEQGFPVRSLGDPHWLKHEKIRSVTAREKRSANGTFLVEFENNRKAIFKPFASEEHYGSREADAGTILFSREIGAYEIVEFWLKNRESREVGLSAVFVPETIETLLVHQGRSYGVGSLQAFQNGFVTAEELSREMTPLWNELRSAARYTQAEARIRTLDWLLGNYDRLPNSIHTRGNYTNFMIGLDQGSQGFEIAMIDNGFGQGRRSGFWLRDLPTPEQIPADLAQAIRELDLPLFRQTNEGRLSQIAIDDFCERVTLLRSKL